jgi:hypothetical protein
MGSRRASTRLRFALTRRELGRASWLQSGCPSSGRRPQELHGWRPGPLSPPSTGRDCRDHPQWRLGWLCGAAWVWQVPSWSPLRQRVLWASQDGIFPKQARAGGLRHNPERGWLEGAALVTVGTKSMGSWGPCTPLPPLLRAQRKLRVKSGVSGCLEAGPVSEAGRRKKLSFPSGLVTVPSP